MGRRRWIRWRGQPSSSQQLVSRSLALSACNLLFNPDVKSSSRRDLVVVCHHCHCKRQLATRWHLDDEVRVPLWGHTVWTWIVSGCYKRQKNVVHWVIRLLQRMDLLSIWPAKYFDWFSWKLAVACRPCKKIGTAWQRHGWFVLSCVSYQLSDQPKMRVT